MQKIKIEDKYNPDEILTQEQMVEELNKVQGNLNEEDGYDCPKCLNRGYFHILENGQEYIKYCDCRKIRLTIKRLKECGIQKSLLDKFKFKTFDTDEEWRKSVKDRVFNYIKNIIDNNKNDWLVISGQTGCGKSHLCTATFQELIKRGKQGEYLLWNTFVKEIIPMEKSVYEDVQKKYHDKLQRIANVDILYIDDLFKLTENKYSNQSISLAYKILNDRYNNNKLTIISTEYYPKQIEEIDSAICGRINESCNFGDWWIRIKYDPSRNYRMKESKEI